MGRRRAGARRAAAAAAAGLAMAIAAGAACGAPERGGEGVARTAAELATVRIAAPVAADLAFANVTPSGGIIHVAKSCGTGPCRDDTSCGGTRATACLTIGFAVSKSRPGDRIHVHASATAYAEPNVFTPRADDGAGGQPRVIRGVASAEAARPRIASPNPFKVDGASFYVFDNLEVDCLGAGGPGFYLIGANHVAVRNSDVSRCTSAAVHLRFARDVLVEGNDLHDNRDTVQRAAGPEHRDAHAVVLEGAARAVVRDNDTFGNSGDSLQCAGSEQGDPDSTDLVIEGNRMRDDVENAVDIKSCNRVVIRGNKIFEYSQRKWEENRQCGGDAIVLHYAARNVLVEGNEIFDAGGGVKIGNREARVTDVVLRRNRIHHVDQAEARTLDGTLRFRCGDGVNIAGGDRIDVVNNTFDSIAHSAVRVGVDDRDAIAAPTDVRVWNNVIANVRGSPYVTWGTQQGIRPGGALDYHTRSVRLQNSHNLVPPDAALKLALDGAQVPLAAFLGPFPDANLLRADPLFDPAPGHRLQPGSPALDRALQDDSDPGCDGGLDRGAVESDCAQPPGGGGTDPGGGTTDPPPAPSTCLDEYGDEVKYATKQDGMTWFLPATGARGGGVFKPDTFGESTTTPGVYETTAASVRMRVYVRDFAETDRRLAARHPGGSALPNHPDLARVGHMLDPDDWKNVEMTGFVRLLQGTGDQFTWIVRSARHSDPVECEGSSYHAFFNYDGKVQVRKETWHSPDAIGGVDYGWRRGPVEAAPPIGGLQAKTANGWVGLKSVVRNRPDGKVRIQLFVDDDGDGEGWRQVLEEIDGEPPEFDNGPAARCGETSATLRRPITWGGPIAMFRWDDAPRVQFKKLSVREIAPMASLTDDGACVPGTTPTDPPPTDPPPTDPPPTDPGTPPPDGAATIGQALFLRQFGTPADEYGYGVALAGGADLFFAGYTMGNLYEANQGGRDATLGKYSPDGATLRLGDLLAEVGDQHALGAAIDPAGNVYLAGYTTTALWTPYLGGATDGFLARYDAATTGEEAWSHTLGTAGSDRAMAVATDAAGNVYVVGWTSGDMQPGFANPGGLDAWLVKYDSTGSRLWTRQIGTAGDDVANGVTVSSTGDVYVTGSTSGTFPGEVPGGLTDVFVAKYDPSGARQWVKQRGTAGEDEAFAAAADAAGNVYVAGASTGGIAFTNQGGVDAFLLQYLPDGRHGFSRQLGTAGDEWANGVAFDGAGALYLTGSTTGLVEGAGSGGHDIFVAKYATTGDRQWMRQLGTALDEVGKAAFADATGVWVAGGTFGAFPGATSAGGKDMVLLKFSATGTR